MSNTSANALIPPAMPRTGTAAAQVLPNVLARLGRALWRQMEAVGRARAQRELLSLATLYAHQPDIARRLREAARWQAQAGADSAD